MRSCPIHHGEVFESSHALKIHLSKANINKCPVCNSPIKGGSYEQLKKHVLRCKKGHEELAKVLLEL